MITELEFKSLAQAGYNRIPLMAEAFADLETPLSLYLKLAHSRDGGKYSFLLESVVGGERFGRYSFIGLPARTLVRASGFGADALTEVVRDGKVIETAAGNPLDFVAAYQKRFKVALRPGLPRFCGGLAGYFGYKALSHYILVVKKVRDPSKIRAPLKCMRAIEYRFHQRPTRLGTARKRSGPVSQPFCVDSRSSQNVFIDDANKVSGRHAC